MTDNRKKVMTDTDMWSEASFIGLPPVKATSHMLSTKFWYNWSFDNKLVSMPLKNILEGKILYIICASTQWIIFNLPTVNSLINWSQGIQCCLSPETVMLA